jgi:Uncharacterized metal-binding protein
MSSCVVNFINEGLYVTVDEGTTISEAARKIDCYIPNTCGGEGICGKCRVKVNGNISGGKGSGVFSKQEQSEGWILACKAMIIDDVDIITPVYNKTNMKIIKISDQPGNADNMGSSWVEKIFLQLDPPSLMENVADTYRLEREILKIFPEKRISFSPSILPSIGQIFRESSWQVTVTVFLNENEIKVIKLEKGDSSSALYGLAVDIGTTTVAMELVSLASGEVIAKEGSINAQTAFGEDVISRIIYAGKSAGMTTLKDAISDTINRMINNILQNTSVALSDISVMTIAGNTTMCHLAVGINPSSIRIAPYVPVVDTYPFLEPFSMNLNLPKEAVLIILPSVSSYVGGDIVAGVLSCSMHTRNKILALIDIGTNGEIVIGGGDMLVCCSASAGPSFEGGGTTHGTWATSGAIEKVKINGSCVDYTTIGNSAPNGICGSGFIDLIWELFRNDIISPVGKFNVGSSDRICLSGDSPSFILAYAKDTAHGADIIISEIDIDLLIKSKAAVFSAMKSLMDYTGLSFETIDELHVAGGFGSGINIDSAVGIGLLPDIDRRKIKFIGNSSLHGATNCLLSRESYFQAVKIARSMTNLELSIYPPYMDEFIASIFLPHTDNRLFPSVKTYLVD